MENVPNNPPATNNVVQCKRTLRDVTPQGAEYSVNWNNSVLSVKTNTSDDMLDKTTSSIFVHSADPLCPSYSATFGGKLDEIFAAIANSENHIKYLADENILLRNELSDIKKLLLSQTSAGKPNTPIVQTAQTYANAHHKLKDMDIFRLKDDNQTYETARAALFYALSQADSGVNDDDRPHLKHASSCKPKNVIIVDPTDVDQAFGKTVNPVESEVDNVVRGNNGNIFFECQSNGSALKKRRTSNAAFRKNREAMSYRNRSMWRY